MANTVIQWSGVQQMQTNCGVYNDKVVEAVHAVLNYFQPLFEEYSKQNARWTDRTGNARQGLNSDVVDLAEAVVMLYLAHGMDYGLWLEVRWSGRYAIIWPTIQAHLNEIANMLRGILG